MYIVEVGGDGIPTFVPEAWDSVADAIRSLDAKHRHTVFLKGPGSDYLAIMATADGWYNCTVFDDSTGQGSTLITPGGSQEVVPIYLNEVTRRELVDLSAALKAARTYAEEGKLDDSLSWEKM